MLQDGNSYGEGSKGKETSIRRFQPVHVGGDGDGDGKGEGSVKKERGQKGEREIEKK